MRATKNKHCGSETKTTKQANAVKTEKKSRKAVRASSVGFAFVIAATALIVPTTTLAPGVEAYADSRIASYSVGDIDKFSSVIKSNCVEPTTAPAAEAAAEETTAAAAKETKKAPAKAKTEEKKSEKAKAAKEEKVEETTVAEETTSEANEEADNSTEDNAGAYYAGSALVDIAYPDYSYSPSPVSLSDYDRAKLERLVMGEAGTMGFTGAALVAQSIRDAMNRSGTSSIDQIIYEYQYFGSTDIEPNSDVMEAVSYIFDGNGSAVQHRVLCFYIGSSAWHETQNFLVDIDGVRFFDLNV